LDEAIKMAGGFNPKANTHYIELIRYKVSNNERIRIIKKLDFEKNRFLLMRPYDEIYVKKIANWDERKVVEIKGEVKYPGFYTISKGDRLYDVIKRAGGFTKQAYLYGAVFTREAVKKMQQKQLKNMIFRLKKKATLIAASAKGLGESSFDTKALLEAIDALSKQAQELKPIGRIAVKLGKDLEKFKNSPYNILLKDKDTLFIPTKPNFVTVMGEVLTPTAFVYSSQNPYEYIQKAGGTTENADNIFFVVQANGFTKKGELKSWFFSSLKVKEGDVITVPLKVKTTTWSAIAKDLTSIAYQLAVTAASLKTIGAF